MLLLVQLMVFAVAVVAVVPETSDHGNVEFPLTHYKRLYEEARAEHEALGLDKRQKACPSADFCKKKVATCPGFHLLTKDNEGEPCSPLKIGDQTLELKPVIYYPIKGSKCCAARQCVVSDCKAVSKEFQFDGKKKCTKNGKPNGAADKCQVRKPKHVCGCDVKMCMKKDCAKLPACDSKCFKKNIKFDECKCIKTEGFCTVPPPGTDQCLKNGSKKCKKCEVCSDETAFPGCDKIKGKLKAKGKELTKIKKCKPVKCTKPKACDACTQSPKTITGGCCPKVECKPLSLPPCKAPQKGKCAGCETKISRPLNSENEKCKRTVECCVPKKCETKVKPCKKCHKKISTKKDKCGCTTVSCKRIPQPEDIVTHDATSSLKRHPPKNGFEPKKNAWCSKQLTKGKPESIFAEFREKVIVAKVSFAAINNVNADAQYPRKFDVIASNDKKKWVTVVSFEDNKVYVKGEGSRTYTVPFTSRKEYYKVYGIRVKEIKGIKGVKDHACLKDLKFVIVNNEYCNGCETKTSKKVFMGGDPKCPHSKKFCVPKPCKPSPPCDKCEVTVIIPNKCKCPVKKCHKATKPPCNPGECPTEYPAQPGCPSKGGLITICGPCCKCPPLNKDPPCQGQCKELKTDYVRHSLKCPLMCPEKVCKKISKCINSAKEAQKRLKCKKCETPVKTDVTLSCGCKKWECKSPPKPAVCPKCPSCKAPKIVKINGCPGSTKCECLPKKCPSPSPCEKIKVDSKGKTVKDACNCPKIENKPCTSVSTRKCTKGGKLVTVKDKCGCSVTGVKLCDQKQDAIPKCKKCETLVTEDDGECCKKWKCVKKVCAPVNKNLECKKCEEVVVKDDECHCCKASCKPVKCNPVGKCLTPKRPSDAKKGSDGYFYKHHSQKVNYNQAAAACKKAGGLLAIAYNDRVQNYISSQWSARHWVGGSDQQSEGAWKGPDGKALPKTYWAGSEPNGRRNENCIVANWVIGKWNDISCSNKFPFLCQFFGDEEPVLVQDECNCQVKIGCKPPGYGGGVTSCPKPKICESEVPGVKLCKHCYKNE